MTDTKRLNIGLWQAAGVTGDVPANMAEIARAARQVAGRTDLLVFPECFLTGYYTEDPVAPVAAQVTRDRLRALAALSTETGVALILGSYEPDGPRTFNSAFVFVPGGGLLGAYRKQMLFGAWEKRVFAAGESPFLFDLKGFRVGVLICYDVEFPECARALARRGTDLIAVPTALMEPYDTVPRITVPARAIENHCFVAYANRTGRDAAHTYLGQSLIVDPLGKSLAAGDTAERLVLARLDVLLRATAREGFDYLADLETAKAGRTADD